MDQDSPLTELFKSFISTAEALVEATTKTEKAINEALHQQLIRWRKTAIALGLGFLCVLILAATSSIVAYLGWQQAKDNSVNRKNVTELVSFVRELKAEEEFCRKNPDHPKCQDGRDFFLDILCAIDDPIRAAKCAEIRSLLEETGVG